MSAIRGTVYTLFAAVLLSALWVTSLTIISGKSTATELVTEAGTQILNPFLVGRGAGLTESNFATLEAGARANPSQPIPLPLLKVQVLGGEIVGKNYGFVVNLVYKRLAETYYTGGAGAVFDVPPGLKNVLPNFAVFNPDNVQPFPGGPTVAQLPPFLQPLFVFVGLTPDTFTAAGHQRLVSLLAWFWIAVVVLGVLAVALNRSEQKLSGLAQSVVHSTWPIVLVLGGLWIASLIYRTTFAPYAGVLALIRGAFLPVYGAAFAAGLVALVAFKLLPAWQQRGQSKEPAKEGVAFAAGGVGGPPAALGTMPGTMPPVEPRVDTPHDASGQQ